MPAFKNILVVLSKITPQSSKTFKTAKKPANICPSFGFLTWAFMGSHDVRGWTSPYTTSSCSFAKVPITER